MVKSSTTFLLDCYLLYWYCSSYHVLSLHSHLHFFTSLFLIVQLQLNLSIKAFLYNTAEAYYSCTFVDGICSLSILFPNGNAAVLTSPGPEDVSLCTCLLQLLCVFSHYLKQENLQNWRGTSMYKKKPKFIFWDCTKDSCTLVYCGFISTLLLPEWGYRFTNE